MLLEEMSENKKVDSAVKVKIEPADDYEVIKFDSRNRSFDFNLPAVEVHVVRLSHDDLIANNAAGGLSRSTKPIVKKGQSKAKVHSCKICDFKTAVSSHLKRHEILHTSRAGCPVCRRPVDPRRMESHLLEHSPGFVKVSRSCEICSKSCTTSCSLSIHWRKCHFTTHGPRNVWLLKNKRPKETRKSSLLQCDHCGESFKAQSLQLHMRLNHMLEKRHLSCKICDFRTSFKNKINQHKRDHLTKQECGICRRPYSERFMLYHMKSHSPNSDSADAKKNDGCPSSCDKCGKVFMRRNSLLAHLKCHLPSRELAPQVTTTCPCCYKIFDVKALEKHIEKTHRRHHFKCYECDESFLYSEKLRLHKLKTHYDGELHECHCGAAYKNTYDLQKHQKAHDPPITCDVCHYVLADRDALYNHWRTWHFQTHGHFGDWRRSKLPKVEKKIYVKKTSDSPKVLEQNGLYKCDCCDKIFESRNLILNHVKHVANLYHQFQQQNKEAQVPKACPYCYKTFDEKILDNHIEKTHRKENFKCRECDGVFQFKELLRLHNLKAHYEGELHECHCGALFDDKYKLSHHQKAHDPPITCDICSRFFEDKDSLSVHWRFTHLFTHGSLIDWRRSQQPKVEKCQIFKKKILKFPVPLKQKGPYTCDICSFKCLQRNSIYGHLKYFHFRSTNAWSRKQDRSSKKWKRGPERRRNIILKNIGLYTCDKCGRVQKNRRSFLEHSTYMHGGRNQVSCNLCPNTFSQRQHLKNHLKHVHFPKKAAYNCSDCGKAFYSKAVMRSHQLESHFEGALFRCHCGAVFKDRSGLKQHESVHGIAKHECELCDFKSRHRATLCAHWKAKHFESKGSRASWRESMGITNAHLAVVVLDRIDGHIFDKNGNLLPDLVSITEQIALDRERVKKEPQARKVQKSMKTEARLRKSIKFESPQVTTTCPCCYKTFDVKALEKHIEKTHRRHNFKCLECDESFLYSEKLRIHKLRTHYDGELHECHCGAVYKNKYDLNHHQKAHDPPITCDVCHWILSDRDALYNHWRTWHLQTHGHFGDWRRSKLPEAERKLYVKKTSDSPKVLEQNGLYTCDCCARTFESRNKLVHHVKHVGNLYHQFQQQNKEAQVPKACPCCYKTFDEKILDNHIEKTHRKENFKCRECDGVFQFKELLRLHILKAHYEGELHECHCGAVFDDKYKLSHHQKAHDAPITCDICSRFFEDKDSLSVHWRFTHYFTHGPLIDWRRSQLPKIEKVKKIKKKVLKFPVVLKQEGPYTCDICGLECSERTSIYSHLKYFHFRSSKSRKSRKTERVQRFPIILDQEGPYTCDVCGIDCVNRRSVMHHLRTTHFLKLNFKCEVCPAAFNSRPLLRSHMQESHPAFAAMTPLIEHQLRERKSEPAFVKTLLSQDHTCKECGEAFRLKSLLRRHFLRNHFEGKIHECHCGAVFKKERHLQVHQRLHTERSRDCEVCGKTFQKYSSLYSHWAKVHSRTHGIRQAWRKSMAISARKWKKRCIYPALHLPGPYTCDVCGAICKTRGSIFTHLKYQHFQKNFLYCDLCPKSFNMKSLLTDHLRNHFRLGTKRVRTDRVRTNRVKTKVAKTVTCLDCGEIFQSRGEPRNHILRSHYSGTLHQCHCGKVFKSQKNLSAHQLYHADAFDCELCGQTLKCEIYKYEHWRMKHSAEHGLYHVWKLANGIETTKKPANPFVCDICGHLSLHRRSLLAHLKAAHFKPEKKMKLTAETDGPQVTTTCPCCYKIFDVKALEKHIEKTHRRHKFKCYECDEIFFYSEKLRIHNLKTHYDGELHDCHCGAVYRNKYDLNHHQKAHDPPITCDVCCRIFIDRYGLYRHWKVRHFKTHGAFGEWKRNQLVEPSDFLIVDIQSGWDGLDSDFDCESYFSEDEFSDSVEDLPKFSEA